MPRSHEAERVIEGRLEMGGQDHFYLETHIAYAIPGEDGDMTVHSSTQHPERSAAPHRPCAGRAGQFRRRLHAPHGRRLRRQGKPGDDHRRGRPHSLPARPAKPVKLRLKRSIDMTATGKRHDMVATWKAGVGEDGRIQRSRHRVSGARRQHARPDRSGADAHADPFRQFLFHSRRPVSSAMPARPTPSPTPRFAVSAVRRASSPSRRSWTRSRANCGSIRTPCAPPTITARKPAR